MGEVLEKEMRDPAHEQSDHNSGGETAPAPKEVRQEALNQDLGPRGKGCPQLGRSSSKPCACQIGFLLAFLYGLPTGALACAKVLLHFTAGKGSPEKCPATCKAMVL